LTLGIAQSLKLFPVGAKSLEGVKDFSAFANALRAGSVIFVPLGSSMPKKQAEQLTIKACCEYGIQDSYESGYWNKCLTIVFSF
jgi:hypothetical protein